MPDWAPLLRRALRKSATDGASDERVIGELSDHLEDVYQEALRSGSTSAEAQEVAWATLGDPKAAADALAPAKRDNLSERESRWAEDREEPTRQRGSHITSLFAGLVNDLRLGIRGLARRPLFSSTVIAVLSLGIGATAAIFTLIDAILLAPLPFENEERLVSLHHTAPGVGFEDAGQCAAWHTLYEESSTTLDHVGMFTPELVAVQGNGRPEALRALRATHGTLRALELRPIVGRTLDPADEAPGAAKVVLLSHDYWQSRFAGEASAVGQQLRIEGATHEIVGVVPPQLQGLGLPSDLVLPFEIERSSLYVGNIGFGSVARLRETVSLEQARAELQQLLPTAWTRFPGGPIATKEHIEAFSVQVIPYKDRLVGDTASVLWVLLGGVGLVLLVACANVANLLFVRASEQRNDMAVRAAIGASVARVRWEMFKEVLLLSLAGGLGGIVLAAAGLRGLTALAPADVPRLGEAALSPRVLLFVLALALASAAIAGVVPMLRMRSVGRALRQAGTRVASSKGSQAFRSSVAVLQIAVVLVLLVASLLMLRSFLELRGVEPGFGAPEDVLTLQLHIPAEQVPDHESVARQFETIAHRLEEIPGVDEVTVGTAIPLDGNNNVNTLYTESSGGAERGEIERHKWIGGGFFRTLQIPLLAGEELSWQDARSGRPAVVVSASLARKYWGSTAAALGQKVAARPEPPFYYEIVGVAADVRDDGVRQESPAMVYWPLAPRAFWRGTGEEDRFVWRTQSFAIRNSRSQDPYFLRQVQNAIWEINPRLALFQTASLERLAQSDPSVAGTLFISSIADDDVAGARRHGAIGESADDHVLIAVETHRRVRADGDVLGAFSQGKSGPADRDIAAAEKVVPERVGADRGIAVSGRIVLHRPGAERRVVPAGRAAGAAVAIGHLQGPVANRDIPGSLGIELHGIGAHCRVLTHEVVTECPRANAHRALLSEGLAGFACGLPDEHTVHLELVDQ
ncbi:MAG: ABC transporter permease [Thermoanaerobaculia bacterium]|nr:ABC transporter permease [Thermoanaerobaculia bacterium]